ncbi:hypothetical protein BKA70DRAFT_1424028 [Coprinopsis sp. MPI-PUGE-AT-0042]|nr:hypothetical protein BKA70DRAFT_1424028 [Coprinopsis sp. MPI-PUGE-AT-0042]
MSSTFQLLFLLFLSFQLSFFSVLGKPTSSAPNDMSNGYQTNAQRLRAGLPPLPPKRRFEPTKATLAARSGPSPTPFSGYVQVRDYATNADLGWVGKVAINGRLLPVTAPNLRLPVGFTYYSPTNVFEMAVTDGASSWRYIGAQANQMTAATGAVFVRTNSVPSGSPPQSVGHSLQNSGPSESHVWKFDAATKEFTSTWVQPGGLAIDTYFHLQKNGGNFLHFMPSPNHDVTFWQRVRLFLV